MSFIVCPNPVFNSFSSLAHADTYHADRGNDAWSNLSSTHRQNHLVRATDYIKANYTFSEQPWDDEVLPELKEATALLALYSSTVDLAPIESGRVTLSESESLSGVGAFSATYSTQTGDRFRQISAMLSNIAVFTPATNGGRITLGRLII